MRNIYFKASLKLLTLSSALLLTNPVRSQHPQGTEKHRLHIQKRPLRELLKQVEQQTGYHFNYDQHDIKANQEVSFSVSATNIDDLLKLLSSRFQLSFNISGRNIAIRKSAASQSSQVRIITGVVSDAAGDPIPGVNIFRKGTRQGAVTNIKGEFTLRLVGSEPQNAVLSFSSIGMKTREEVVGQRTFFNVSLEAGIASMKEVIVTSSYTRDKRREEVVGSISQLNNQQLQVQRPIESFDKMLEGLVAGVNVETTTELNTPVKVYIRGQGSFPTFGATRSTSTQPLYVIDGIPMYEQQRGDEATMFSNESYLNPLSNINPEDIKTISVLKDATASALYGANAANGVIIITTKSGTSGKTSVQLNYDTGISSFINEYKWLTGPQYYSLLREAYINGGRSVTEASQLAGSKTIDTDWFDLTNRNAVYHNVGLNISGGSEKTTFRAAAGYRNQQASSLGNDIEKMYFRLRVDHKSDKLKMGFSLSPTVSRSNNLSMYGGVILPPNVSPVNEQGAYGDILGVPNPLAVLNQNENNNKGVQLLANANASYQVTPEIAISGTLGADYYQNQQRQFRSAQNATGRNLNGSLQIYDRNYLGYVGFLQATYDKTFNNNHTLSFLIGTQVEDKETNLLRGAGTGFTYDKLRTLNAAATQTAASSTAENAAVSYYSQLAYDLNKKYYANVNARIDKSSIFGGDKQVAFNGSIGLAWIISKEDFLKDNTFINFLRLRTTFGSTGNSRIGSYAARGLYSFGTGSGDNYSGNIIATPESSSAPNPSLSWEKNYKLNFGLDFTLFNKLQFTTEYYRNYIVDLISSVLVPSETGFSTISANTGKMLNQGFELTLNAGIVSNKDFSWNLAYNIGTNRNKITAYNRGFTSTFSTATDAAALKVGNSASAIYGYRWGGVDPQTGTERFYGPDGSTMTASQINALPISQTTILGDRLPDFQGGMVNNFRYRDFTLSFNILYSYGADKLFSYVDEADGRNLQNRNQSVNLLDRWQRPGDITDIPSLLINRSIVANSSRYLYDVSYLKLSNVSLGYTLKQHVAQHIGMSNASVFVNANNLFYLYKDAGTKGRNGIAEKRFVYPETSTFILGIRLGF